MNRKDNGFVGIDMTIAVMTIIILFLSCAIVFVVNIRKFKKADSTFYYERNKKSKTPV